MVTRKTPIPQFATETELYLLHACLGKDRESIQFNLSKWKTAQDFDLIDVGSYRLMPLLQKQLKTFQIEDANISIYKGIYRKCWMKNKMLFNDLVKVSALLQSNGIPVLILKGVALSVLYYKDNGIRPMDDADILIPFDKLELALTIFNDNGWHSRYDVSKETISKYFKYLEHSADYKNDAESYIDVHWKPLYIASPDAIDKELWYNTQSIVVNGIELETVNHEFNFFHVVVHGIRWNPQSSIRWIVDAVIILRSTGDQFNWSELITMAQKYHAVVHLKEAIRYLVSFFNAPVPAWVEESLAAIPITSLEKKEYRVITHQDPFYNIIYYSFFVYYLKLRTVSEKWKSLPFLSGYINYLRLRLEIDSAWKIIFVLPQRIIIYFLRKVGFMQKKRFGF